MDLLREDVRRQILAIEKAHQAEGEPVSEEFHDMLMDPVAFATYFQNNVWLALDPNDRIEYYNKYHSADAIERPFVASGLLKCLSDTAEAADEELRTHDVRATYLQ